MSPRHPIRKDPDIMNLLSRLPRETASTLTDTQLSHIKIAIGSGQYRKHKVDIRGAFPVPLFTYKIYFVLLMGRNLRSLSRQEQSIAVFSIITLILAFFVISTVTGLVVLYLVKSMLGINLLEDFSLGLWDWLRQVF